MKKKETHTLQIGWLYPDHMSTYGDRGNVTVLARRLEWRGLRADIVRVDFRTTAADMEALDLVFGGGAQDRQQTLVVDDLRRNKGPVLASLFDKGVPGLFVCGSPQLLGHTYMTGDGQTLQGLGIFDMESRHFGTNRPRLIGNLVAGIPESFRTEAAVFRPTVVGFENHGGRTYLGSGVIPFARVIRGFGNNGEDGSEGAVYRNCIATYSHGPFLPKNPHIADWLLTAALTVKYGKKAPRLEKIDDELAWKAHEFMLKKLTGSSRPAPLE